MSSSSFPTGRGQGPVFRQPEDLVAAVYRQVVAARDDADFDPEAGFDECTLFSRRLSTLLESANAQAEGGGGKALGFSPFLNRPDARSMTAFTSAPARMVDDRAVIAVEITIKGQPPQYLDVLLVEEGEGSWKVDDIVLKPTFEGLDWRLSKFLANPDLPFEPRSPITRVTGWLP